MFTTFKYRRQIAVLAALAMVASVMVAAPVSAADPEPSLEPTFSACVGDATESAGFEDVPANHPNIGDINCIAYYGITQGTSATTYSPVMSVTREHMALFLIRLADRVDIPVVANPPDAGFTDVGDLSAGSQLAINQLADLGITQGTSATTYSPADAVTRGQMALFISRLMDKMTPYGGDKSTDAHTPSDVDSLNSTEVGSPFTDLGSATKATYDAITALYELGVASGLSPTSYVPDASITRHAMAEFMAGVMAHSNLRPNGLSIQAASHDGYGQEDPIVVVSYRDNMFSPMEGKPVAIFSVLADQTPSQDLKEDGTCPSDIAGLSCDWSENSHPADSDGNIDVTTEPVSGGDSRTWYAWIGDAKSTKFDADTANAVTVTISTKKESDDLTASLSKSITENNAGSGTTAAPYEVNLDARSSVTVTVQLVEGDDDNKVARAGQEITLDLTQAVDAATVYQNDEEAKMKTDSSGKATFTLEGPKSTDGDDPDRTDTLVFTGKGDGATVVVLWSDEARIPHTGKVELGSAYQIISDAKIAFRVTYRLFDQYGDPIQAPLDAATADDENDREMADMTIPGTSGAVERPVSKRGVAVYSASIAEADYTLGSPLTISVAGITDVTAATATVTPVSRAADDTGISTTPLAPAAVYKNDNRFHIGGTLWTYDSGDTFIVNGKTVSMDDFEKALGVSGNLVAVLVYDDDGVSIFRISS